jgi:hypothetical protein
VRDTNRIEQFRFIRKDPSSGSVGCPAIAEVAGGHAVIAKALTGAEEAAARAAFAAAGCPVADDEIIGFMPAGTINDTGS